jgi:hypothetical protein
VSSMRWMPPPRPVWMQRLIGHGDAVGGAAHVVPLDPEELIATAAASTGLDDFGADTWRPHYDVLLRSIETEANLHLAGRVMTRTEILRSLRARLGLTALWARDPAILERGIVTPVFVVGFARSGTSILHELLALEPAARPALTWELLHPAEAASRDPAVVAAVRRNGDLVHSFWADVQPEYDAMHHNAGDLPNECIFATAHEFLSDHWGGCHVVPTYSSYLATADHTDAYRYHLRVLQTLQGGAGATQWVLKAPSHLATLATLLAVYPDARIVHIHRDPLKTVPSTLSLLGMLKWLRSDRVELGDMAPFVSAGFAAMLNGIIAARAQGSLPDDRFVDVRYADLMDDPGASVAHVQEQLGWPSGDGVRARARDYIAAKPKGAHGEHRYALEDFGLDAAEQRALFARYCEHFAVPREV